MSDRTAKKSGWQQIQDELARAREMGFSPQHDDAHTDGALAVAAQCYLEATAIGSAPRAWPWHAGCWSPGTRAQNLRKAGALCLAEAERLVRAGLHVDDVGAALERARGCADLLDVLAAGAKPCPRGHLEVRTDAPPTLVSISELAEMPDHVPGAVKWGDEWFIRVQDTGDWNELEAEWAGMLASE